jgi:hypothetical protein
MEKAEKMYKLIRKWQKMEEKELRACEEGCEKN